MAIKRYKATKDTTITDSFKVDNKTRAEGANMGLADSVEVFYLYGRSGATTKERCRFLVEFDVDQLIQDIADGKAVDDADTKYFLRIFNVGTPFTVPRLVNLSVHALTKTWDEGNGVDLDEYKDEGAPGDGTWTGDTAYTGTGASWQVASVGVSWTAEGGDFGPSLGVQFLDNGTEDIELDITTQVKAWIAGPSTNYGLLVKLENESTALEAKFVQEVDIQVAGTLATGAVAVAPAGAFNEAYSAYSGTKITIAGPTTTISYVFTSDFTTPTKPDWGSFTDYAALVTAEEKIAVVYPGNNWNTYAMSALAGAINNQDPYPPPVAPPFPATDTPFVQDQETLDNNGPAPEITYAPDLHVVPITTYQTVNHNFGAIYVGSGSGNAQLVWGYYPAVEALATGGAHPDVNAYWNATNQNIDGIGPTGGLPWDAPNNSGKLRIKSKTTDPITVTIEQLAPSITGVTYGNLIGQTTIPFAGDNVNSEPGDFLFAYTASVSNTSPQADAATVQVEVSNTNSAYDKKFSGRGSEYFFKKPYIESRWPDYEIDDRDNFYAYSPNVPDNTNTIVLRNYFNGVLTNMVNSPPSIKFYSTEIFPTLNVSLPGLTATGIIFDLSITGGPIVTLIPGTDFLEGATAVETATAIVRAVKLNEELATYLIADNRRGSSSTIKFREGPNKFLTSKQDIIRGPANYITYNDQPFEVPIGLEITFTVPPAPTALTFTSGEIVPTSVDVTVPSTGVYNTAIDGLDTAEDLVYAVWYYDSLDNIIQKEFINVKHREPIETGDTTYVTNITNLKSVYSTEEQARFRLFIRSKDWSPTIYTVATKRLRTEVVEKAYYRITRIVDDLPVIDWGIGDTEHTRISYDELGAFFNTDLSLFEPGWAYRIEIAYEIKGELKVQPESFKFRVE